MLPVLKDIIPYMFTDSTLDGVNVTLPGSVTEYTLTGLIPEVEYTLTLKGVSRSGPGPATTESIKTSMRDGQEL